MLDMVVAHGQPWLRPATVHILQRANTYQTLRTFITSHSILLPLPWISTPCTLLLPPVTVTTPTVSSLPTPAPPKVVAPLVLRIAPAAAVGVALLTPASVLQMVDIRLLLLA